MTSSSLPQRPCGVSVLRLPSRSLAQPKNRQIRAARNDLLDATVALGRAVEKLRIAELPRQAAQAYRLMDRALDLDAELIDEADR